MANITSVKCEHLGNETFIKCPMCLKRQVLKIGDNDYTVDGNGYVHPDFVCMQIGKNGQYCDCSATIKLIGW